MLFALSASAVAQVVAEYDFAGGSAASIDVDATTSASNWTFGAFTGGDTNPAISSFSETFFVRSDATGATAADGDELTEAISNDAFASFTFDASGNSTNLGTLAFDHIITDPSTFDFSVAVMSDLTGGFTAGNEISSFTINSGTGSVNQLVDLTGIGAMQGLTGAVEFRFYIFDTGDTNPAISRLDNIVLTTDVVLPPIDWVATGSGDWSTSTNWSSDPDLPGQGSLIDRDVRFGGSITEPSTVTVDTNVQLNRITFATGNAYTIADNGSNTITLTGDAEINATTGGGHEITGVIAGTAGLTKTGGSTAILSGANTYAGVTDVQEGILRVRNIDSLDNSGTGGINVGTSGNMVLQADVDATGAGFSGTIVPDITGDGALTMSTTLTSETVTLDSAKTFAGRIIVGGGTLSISHADALGTGGSGAVDEASRTEISGNDFEGVDLNGKLEISGGITVATETLNIEQRDAGNTAPHVTNASGNNEWQGTVNLEGGAGSYNVESQADLLTISGDIVDTDDISGEVATLRLSGAGNGRISGLFVDNDGDGLNAVNDNNNIAVVKSGSGTWTIATALAAGFDPATSLYQGDTTIAEGTLEVLTDSPVSNQGELRGSNVIVQSGATLDVDDFARYNLQVGQNLGGAGTVVAQVLGYFDDGSLTPGDSIGTLTINGDLDMDSFSSTPTGALNFELGSTTTLGGSVNDLISVNGNVTIDPAGAGNMFAVNVTPVGGGLATGTYTLIDVVGGGSLSGTAVGSDFGINLIDEQGNALGATRQTFAANVNTAADELQLVVSGAAGNQKWTGSVSSVWNVNLTPNWSGVDNLYFDLDNVEFDDTASNFAVDVSIDVNPASILFSNSNANPYTLKGVGAIKGGASLTISNGGTVTLANDGNTFTGDVNVGTGTFTIGDGVTDGVNVIGLDNNYTIAAGGRVVINDVDGEALNGNISGGGTVENTGAGESSLGGTVTDIAINQNGTGAFTVNGVIAGSSSITKSIGSANFTLSGNNTYTGLTTVDDGTLFISNTDTGTPLGATGAVGSGSETVVDSGTVRANGETGTISESFSLRNGGQVAVGGGDASALTINADVTIGTGGGRLNADGGTGDDGLTIDASVVGASGGQLQVSPGNGSTINVTGNISNNGTLSKTGGGTLALTGATSSISSPVIDVSNGDIDVSATTSGELALVGQTLRVGEGALVSQQIVTSLNTAQDNRISYDPTTPDTDTEGGTTGFQLRVGIDGTGARIVRSLAQWDVSSVIPTGNSLVSVDSASFAFLDNSQAVSTGAEDLELHELTQDFVDSEVTASQASNGNLWTGYTLDGDADPNAAGTGDLGLALGTLLGLTPGADTTNELVFADSANTRQAAQNALSGDGLLSVLLKVSDETTGANRFFAFDDDNDTTPPELNLTVTVSGPIGLNSAAITGDLAIDAASTLEIDLFDPTLFDSLAISGNLDAGGTLDVGLVGSYVFADGDSFDILDFATSSGAFDNINLPALAAGLAWDTSNLLVDGTLAVMLDSVLEGDYNGDMVVSQGDLDIVLLNWGTANFPGDENAIPGGGPFDGAVSQNELDGVLLNWGNTSLAAAAAAVPEPATGLMLVLGCLLALGKRNRG